MKVEELKEVLKPLIKRCIKEMLFEEGFLSSIIKECVNGVSESSIPLTETITKREVLQTNRQQAQTKTKIDLIEKKRRLAEIAADAYGGVNVFEGVQAINESQAPSMNIGAPSNEKQIPSPFSAMERFPGDEGQSLEELSSMFGLGDMKFKI